MIPLTRLATYNGVPVSSILSAEALQKVAADTMVVELLAPNYRNIGMDCSGAAGAALVESIVRDQKKIFHVVLLLMVSTDKKIFV
jgi:malate dehydrogenase